MVPSLTDGALLSDGVSTVRRCLHFLTVLSLTDGAFAVSFCWILPSSLSLGPTLKTNVAGTSLCSPQFVELSLMNTHRTRLAAKAQQLCFCLLLCFRLALAGVPGPCRHSVTQDHLLSLSRLIDNQLAHSCSIIYPFTDCLNLSKVCCVKAALPQILDLLSSHFHYVRSSDNWRYVSLLQTLLFHLYSQGCVPQINEEEEDSPVRFLRMEQSSPKEALKKALAIIQMYISLMMDSPGPVDWDCQEEYAAEEDPESIAGTSPTDCPVGADGPAL